MNRRGVFSISIICFLIALVVANETGTGRRRVSGSDSQEASLRATVPGNLQSTNATGSNTTAKDAIGSRGERERVKRAEYQAEEDYEADYEDEDELKAIAESHEAMSKDDTRNSNASTATTSTGSVDGAFIDAKNFDSREVITNSSDEDVASNEAITDELVDKEVAELLKYKKERNASHSEGSRTKTKRVPTVKKELSTQKEILIPGNETQVPKSLIPPEDPVNRLSEETEAIQRRNVELNGPKTLEGLDDREVFEHNRNTDQSAEELKKLDKRHSVTKPLKKPRLPRITKEEMKILRYWERQGTLLHNLQEILYSLRDDPDCHDRFWKIFVKNNEEQKSSRNLLDSAKRSFEPTSTLFPSTESSSDSRKSRKKSSKKKKPKHRFTTSTLTPVPATSPLSTTTETPWQTTPVQWRLVAERLFGPPWQQDPQEEPEKTSSYTVSQSPRSLPMKESNKSNGKSILKVSELGDQKLMRLGKIGVHQSGHVQPHREYRFGNAYDGPLDPEHIPDYDIRETHRRLRYPQLSLASQDSLRKREDDYASDFNVQSDGFPASQEYDPRDFALSRSWPDLSYRYEPAWRAEERPLLAPEPWPWRPAPEDPRYWPQRNPYPPFWIGRSYWPALDSEEEAEAEAERMWQQQRAQHRSNWSMEKPLKVPPSWQQQERPAKFYDQPSSGVWEKSKNRSESNNKSSTKTEDKEKVALPQITMKTWNSLTSDPATWPHKLPGAKPWPKDENGKSYNPNADLVKKLGLDKQNNGAWKEQTVKSNDERKTKDEKQSRLFASKEEPNSESFKYKSNDDRSNFSDYKTGAWESKDWKTESMQGDDSNVWRKKNSWSNEAVLPKIQSVGAWVMAADQSTWKPYHIKPIESPSENTSRRWSKPIGGDIKWQTTNKGTRTDKLNDSWLDQSDFWPDKTGLRQEKPGKPGSWYAKTKDSDAWKSGNSNWKTKGEWMSKPQESSWISKVGDNNSWAARGGSWSTRSNESWTSKTNDEVSENPWPVKTKEEDSWPRKSEQNNWSSKNNELSPWQQKMNDEWSYGKSSSTGTWPTKWKQFAYHRVTAVPISKPGTTADAASSKPRNNAFVAVSAVSSPKYTGNDWRKNEEDARNENSRVDEQDRSGNQVGLERPIYAWKKDQGLRAVPARSNSTDPLENQLEALRQIDFWSDKENEAEYTLLSMASGIKETTSTLPSQDSNSTTPTTHRRGVLMVGNEDETNRRTIAMK